MAGAGTSGAVGVASDSQLNAGAISLGLGSSAAASAPGSSGAGLVGNAWPVFSGSTPAGGAARSGTSAAHPYSMQAILFRPEQFRSKADCLTAAARQLLPLEVCR